MADILKYRIPGQENVELIGRFREIESIKSANGFLMSTFLKDTCLEFVPTLNLQSKPSFNKEKPFIIDKSEYLESAKSFLFAFKEKKIKKAVFSRIKEVPFDDSKINEFFDSLCEVYPKAFVYLVSGEVMGTWIGASPETLLHVFSSSGFTMSLAATKAISDKSKEWGVKEKMEQEFVTDFIQEKLNSLGIKNPEFIGPYDVEAGPVVHLRTDIIFDIGNNKIMDIAHKLHPTPAISGLPQKEAIDLINFREAHNRDYYTGIIGIVNQNSASLYVNLRCCQIQKGAAYLYLGGGFTEDSIPELEWEETENKSRTLLNVIEKI